MTRVISVLLLLLFSASMGVAEDGYRLWLRYDRIEKRSERDDYRRPMQSLVISTPTGTESEIIKSARSEIARGLDTMLERELTTVHVVKGSPDSTLEAEGYALDNATVDGETAVRIRANSDAGALFGVFDLLRLVQMGETVDELDVVTSPKINRRLLNHWGDLNGFVERGYAGFSLWRWHELPEIKSPRYTDYARALASVGLNGTVVTSVNANALILTPEYLRKVAALADTFRPWGIRTYLTARYSAPIEIGGLETADPLDPTVQAWWDAKIDEIYAHIPDFGGFVVKANSEGQPGPHDYDRNHAVGANLLAAPLAKNGRDGIVMWRAFVYDFENDTDRVKQAYNQFVPLDGEFDDNVFVQIKNGPLDFMPREAFSPLFGATPETKQMVELQITQEYLGASMELAYLGTMWEEVLRQDTLVKGEGSTIGTITDGSLHGHELSAIAGVANTGSDRNWTGHHLAQANWYAFGRLAWDHTLGAQEIAEEWVSQTFAIPTQTG